MEPNEQNQHSAEFRQKVCLSIHDLVIQRGLPSLDLLQYGSGMILQWSRREVSILVFLSAARGSTHLSVLLTFQVNSY